MSFGWSAGDIAQAIQIIVKVAKAIDGATKEYQDLVAFLSRVVSTLENLRTFIISQQQSPYLDQIREQSSGLKKLVEKLTTALNKYDGKLSQDDARKFYRQLFTKTRWVSSSKGAKESKSAQKEIEDHIKALQTNLMMSSTHTIVHENKKSLNVELDPLKQSITSISKQIGNDDESVTAILRQLAASQEVMNNLIQTISAQVASQTTLQPVDHSSHNKLDMLGAQLGTLISIYQAQNLSRVDSKLHLMPTRIDSSIDISADFNMTSGTSQLTDIFMRYCNWELLDAYTLEISRFNPDPNTTTRIKNLLDDPQAVVVWARGASQTVKTSVFSATVLKAAENAHISVVAYHCSRIFNDDGTEVTQIRLLHHMLLSFVCQVMKHVPNSMASTIDLSPDRLRVVEMSVEDMRPALRLLKECLGIANRPLMFFIDRWDIIEDVSNNELISHLQRLLSLLNNVSDTRKGPWRQKTLITTCGRTALLAEELPYQDQMEIATTSVGTPGMLVGQLTHALTDAHDAILEAY